MEGGLAKGTPKSSQLAGSQGLLQDFFPCGLAGQGRNNSLEEEVSQREQPPEGGRADGLTTGKAPQGAVQLPRATGEPSWKLSPPARKFFLNTRMNHMWILGLRLLEQKGKEMRCKCHVHRSTPGNH